MHSTLSRRSKIEVPGGRHVVCPFCSARIRSFLIILQYNMATLKQLYGRSRYKSRARLITVADVHSAIGATQPPNVHTSTLFCSFVCLMTTHYRSPTCDTSTTLLEAGAIPAILDQLRRWPRERYVIHSNTAGYLRCCPIWSLQSSCCDLSVREKDCCSCARGVKAT